MSGELAGGVLCENMTRAGGGGGNAVPPANQVAVILGVQEVE